MEFYNKESVVDDLNKYDLLAKDGDFIEISKWHNEEGFDVQINNKHISLTHGELDAINYLIKSLCYNESNSNI